MIGFPGRVEILQTSSPTKTPKTNGLVSLNSGHCSISAKMNESHISSVISSGPVCTPCTERDVCCLIARHALYRKGFIPNERKEPDHLMRSVEKLAKKRGRFFAYLPTQTIQISINSYLSENELAKVGCNFVASTSLLLRLHK